MSSMGVDELDVATLKGFVESIPRGDLVVGRHSSAATAMSKCLLRVSEECDFLALEFLLCKRQDVVLILKQDNSLRARFSNQSSMPRLINRSEEHTSELQSRLHLVCR